MIKFKAHGSGAQNDRYLGSIHFKCLWRQNYKLGYDIAIFMAHAAVLRDRPPFSPLGAFLDADDDDNDEDTNKSSNRQIVG
ncbi:hypothetical protein NC653_038483 [Populus alba x Populus x berolinensis]|uniref:Uncharacterized protein n=1 Tax=Populus alba x Populus x berolinensis TaxID=444605 RepID=A0AAD6PTD5_9ROSI|nr:hypothetical protein NC653_038483 [Populus alba x Populus x berolinensis]